MFLGEYSITIDDKGRVTVPTKFRKALAAGAVVTRGLDASLFVMSLEEWGKLAEKLANLPLGTKEARSFSRFMLAGAMDMVLDGQGRFVIPEYLREFASLKKEAFIVGVQNRLEVWDSAKWKEYARQAELSAEDIAQTLSL